MLENMLISLVEWIASFFLDLIPEYTGTDDLWTNIGTGIEMIVDFVGQVNFIIPLRDIVLIIIIDLGIMGRAFVVWVIDWIKDIVVGLIP